MPNLTLDQLKEGTNPSVEISSKSEDLKVLSPDEVAALKPKAEPKDTMKESYDMNISELDKALEAKKKAVYQEAVAPVEEEFEENEDAIFQEEVRDIASGIAEMPKSEEQPVENDKQEKKTSAKDETVNPLFEDDTAEEANDDRFKFDLDELEDDLDLEDEEEQEESENDIMIRELKEEVIKNVKPIKHKLDLSKFTIAKKPISVSKFLLDSETKMHTADWVLYAGKRSITMSELGGSEIDLFNPNNLRGSNRLNAYKKIYECLYRHITDGNKPDKLEAWLKTINFFDQPHLMMAAYRATFAHSNLMNYVCPKCKKPMIKEVPIDDLVKYESEEAKAEFQKILQQDTTSSGTYDVDLIQVSDEYVIGFRAPSIYNIIFETAALPQAFQEKYADIIGIISYIDGFYKIDKTSMELIPVELKVKGVKFQELVKSKVRAYAEMLNILSSDEYAEIIDAMNNLSKKYEVVKYVQPACKCEHCGAEIPEEEQDPEDMLFTRHQLPLIRAFSTK